MAFTIEMREILLALSKDVELSNYDQTVLIKRYTHEGIKFLTQTLPTFAKTVLSALETGSFPSKGCLTAFARKRGLPKFLRGYLSRIFDPVTGIIRTQPCPVALYAVRQACEYFYKLALDFDESTLAAAEANFIKTEEDMSFAKTDQRFIDRVRKNVENFYRFDTYEDILHTHRPRFGPGTFSRDTSERLDYYFFKSAASVATALPNSYEGIKGFFKAYPSSPEVYTVKPDTANRSEVLFVPKDSRGPRVIMREPMHRLRLHMSYFDYLSKYLERRTEGRIQFRDQSVNRKLASIGSCDGSLATLDLKEASDRVQTSVAFAILRNTPLFQFLKTRSRRALLPSGRTIELKKLAGMGSGLTFATMALIIHSAICTEISTLFGMSFSDAARKCYVYGDDVIVPSTWATHANNALRKVGLLVNTNKSFTSPNSRFRESCGGDYFYGSSVEPTRLKLTAGVNFSAGKLTFKKRSLHSGIIQLERHCRELKRSGLNHLAEVYYSCIERAFGVRLPAIAGESPALGRYQLLSPSYVPHQNGMYKKRKVLLPSPVEREHPDPNIYQFIGSAIRPKPFALFEYGCARGCKVAIPRRNRLVTRRISEFRLMA